MSFLERVFPGRRIESSPRHALPPDHDAQPRSSQAARLDPIEVRMPAMPAPPVRPSARTDLTRLLGRHIAEGFAQEVCREYALLPALGAGPARSFQSPEMGVSLLADDQGTITMIVMHFHGDAGFAPYPGVIPGRGGTIPKRGSLWVALGRPDQYRDRAGEYGPSDQWRFPTFTMHALYAPDDENLLRLTLRH